MLGTAPLERFQLRHVIKHLIPMIMCLSKAESATDRLVSEIDDDLRNIPFYSPRTRICNGSAL